MSTARSRGWTLQPVTPTWSAHNTSEAFFAFQPGSLFVSTSLISSLPQSPRRYLAIEIKREPPQGPLILLLCENAPVILSSYTQWGYDRVQYTWGYWNV